MLGTGDTPRIRRILLFTTAGLAVVALPLVYGLAGGPPSRTQSQTPSATTTTPNFEFEVATFKRYARGNSRWGFTPDGYLAIGVTMHMVIEKAYGAKYFQVVGGPAWLDDEHERYDVDARMDSSATEALQKLKPDERTAVQQRMLQALLADRLKLVVHRETKELPVFFLVNMKDGPKLTEADPGNTYANGLRGIDGGPAGPGGMQIGGRGGVTIMTAQAVTMSSLADYLIRATNRTVQDKTGLTGKYDFTLRWVWEDSDSDSSAALRPDRGDAATGTPAPPPPPGAPSIYVAIQQQLGLKLEPGKGPVEIIVIDHIERPSGN